MLDQNFFATIASIFYFSTRLQGIPAAVQCHECYFVDRVTKENASNPELFDESCDRNNIPDNKYLKSCNASSNPKLETSCLRLFINTSEPERRLVTVRACAPFAPSFAHGCNNWTRSSIIKSADIPNHIKDFVFDFDPSTTIEACRCTENDCINGESDRKVVLNEPCSLAKFTCAETKKCLQVKDRCDGFKDCGLEDLSDEENCETCSGGAFRCNTTSRCISFWDTCDGKWDCGGQDISDEENCESCWSNGFHCNITKRCIPVGYWCDRYGDCGDEDRSDEDTCVECSQDTFRCTNSTKCLPKKYICDGTHHCGTNDTIDEENCMSCKNNAFHCQGPSKICVPQLARCNGENDCEFPDKSDEQDCDSCHPKSFHCKINRTCIPILSVCNGINDCGNNDRSDEENCVPLNSTDDTISVTEIGTFNLTSNATNITYVLFDSENKTVAFDANKYRLLLNQTETQRVNIVLEISNVTVEDEGNYTLQIRVADETGKVNLITVFFTVQFKHLRPVFPDFSYTNLRNSTINFTPGETLELNCVTAIKNERSKAKVTWTWQNQSVDDWPPSLNYTLEKNNETLKLEAVPLEEPGRFTCIAENIVGTISSYADVILVLKTNKPVGKLSQLFVPIGGVLGVLVLCFGLLVLRLQCKQRKLRGKLFNIEKELYGGAIENLNPDLHIKEQASLLPFEKGTWEIPRERVKLGTPLGSGAFGLVLKAEATGVGGEEKSTVAVKTVKASADESHFKALVMELKIMANLGKHLHIVNLIGACTENFTKTRELLMVMEFCKYGSLLSYMMDNRKTFINQLDPGTDTIDPTICVQSGGGDNPKSGSDMKEPVKGNDKDGAPEDYYKGDYQVTDASSLKSSDLLSWAFQIAKGMDYLASRKILHGDLAARNVLLSENNIAKICDFGYARETFKNYDYQKDTKGQLLPLKWMAIESLYCGVFSSKSDCWSYGILLWEMFTLGNKPYPGVIANDEFCQRINAGYRMEKPQYAPTSIYQIMMDCWKHEPTERPTFLQIADQLRELMGEVEQKRLHEMSDIYTTLNEVDKTTDYLMRMGEPAVFAVTYGQTDSSTTSSQIATSHYGPEPTCSITTKTNARKSGVRFATFRPAVPRRQM